MKRRSFLAGAGAVLVPPRWLRSGNAEPADIDLSDAVVVLPDSASAREQKAAQVLIEEIAKRSQITLKRSTGREKSAVVIYLGTRASAHRVTPRLASTLHELLKLPGESFVIRTGKDASGQWIALLGSDEKGLFFCVGRFLCSAAFSRQIARIDSRRADVISTPKVALRGHQLGYRPKTNAYDAWNVPMWEQYIRDLTMFGTNSIELLPPRTDDAADSPHFPLAPEQMMIEMSRICDSYDLDVWVWFPAMDLNHADPASIESALKDGARVFEIVPRIDAVFVPGGDPGDTEPTAMFAFLEKQKANLRRFHPKAQMWMSPQGFNVAWMSEFFRLVAQSEAAAWLDGVVFGPQLRLSLSEFRRKLPSQFPVRFYPDITHTLSCQFPVPDWDLAFALTEGRECINPRPVDESNILRRSLPDTIGFLTYSEGCNDDVNKFVWSSLGWDPTMHVMDALRNFSRYFFGEPHAEGIAEELAHLEQNWRGRLATNDGIDITLARVMDIERSASPALLENWRFQQVLYRAYYDAWLRSRLLSENEAVARARGVLQRMNEIGWTPGPLDIDDGPSATPPNGLDPKLVLDEAQRVLDAAMVNPPGTPLRARVRELGEALFQSVHMQLAVDRYQGEAVNRAANLETLETPVTDIAWLRRAVAGIGKLPSAGEQVVAVRTLLRRTDPGPGGFYDELGNASNRPHLVRGTPYNEDPEYRNSALTGFDYPDRLGDTAPAAWKHWAESLYDAPLKMQYSDLDPNAQYRIRVVYGGDSRHVRIRLDANQRYEVHPLIERPWPPRPLEFDLPAEATKTGNVSLAWTREPGLGGNGRGCQVSEVWIIRK